MTDALKPLDIDTVQAFVLVADFASFTRAAEALDTSQAAISLKLKRLEERLGYRLLERTPRHVRLSPAANSSSSPPAPCSMPMNAPWPIWATPCCGAW